MKTNMSIQFRTKLVAGNLNHVYYTGSIIMPKSLCLDFNEYWTPQTNDYSTTASPYRENVF